MKRPSTHPAEQYRRSLTALHEALEQTVALLPHLDSVDMHLSAGDLIEELDNAIATVEHLWQTARLPYR